MRIKINLFVVALFVFFSLVNSNILAQNLSNLSDNDRRSKLIEVAKNVYKAPRLKNFYREYGVPTITSMKTIKLTPKEENRILKDKNDIWYGSKENEKFYIVYFFYDKDKERFDESYAAKVYIWEKTGEAFAIGLGNLIMYPVRNGKIPDHDKPAPPEKYYNITYSKDVPNVANLPKKAKIGDIIKIKLGGSVYVAYDGWTTETGYNFDPKNDLINGEIVFHGHETIGQLHTGVEVYQIMVTGEMKLNVTSYTEEYEDPY